MERIAHIAVIDDEDDFLTIFKFMFRSETTKGLYDLHYFHNGKEFAEFIAENNKKEFFDLVLTDLNMPFMNGFELLKLAHQEIPYVPIFVLSAYGAEDP